MLDFSKLLSTLSEEVKRKPNQKPVGMPLPSEQAIEEVQQGALGASRPVAEQAIATQEGIADEPANADNITTTVPNMGMEVQRRPEIPLPTQDESTVDWSQTSPQVDRNRKPSLQEDITAREQELRSATDAPIEKQSWWKDFGAKLIQGADAFFNGNRAPIVGWGKLKHDYAVKQAEGKLNPLLAMQKQQQEVEYNDARIGKFKTDAENQIRDDNDRFIQSIRKRKYYDPAKASVAERTRLASLGMKPEDLGSWDDRDPKTVKWGDSVWQYDNEKKAWVESGIAKDPTMKPEVYEVDETDADGKVIKDANGNPVTRKFVTTSKGAAALKEYANSRKASLRLGQERLGETRRSNKVREGIAQQQFDFAKTKWNDTMRLRAEAMTRKDAAMAAGDVEGAKKAELDAQKFQSQLDNWKVGWKTKIGTGGFTQEDYDELIGEQ